MKDNHIRLAKKVFPLAFTMGALERMEDTIPDFAMGDIGNILQRTKGFIDCMYILAQEGAALEGKQLTEDRAWFARHCPVNGDFRAYATAAMINAIVAGMEMESDKDTQEEVDVVLEDLKKKGTETA